MNARDCELLRDFVENGSEDAFREIVENYTGLVYGTACRSLGDRHLAEDAVQSTFMILARKARGLSRQVMLGSWLYRTVSLVCSHMKRAAMRRRKWEAVAKKTTELTGALRGEAETTWAFVEPLLDRALQSLSAKSRDAVVSRYLLGKSTMEIAAELGIRENTAAARISYGIRKLRERLATLGVQVSAGLLVTVLGAKAAEAAPLEIVGAAHAAGMAAATGASVATAAAVASEKVMQAMLWAKVKLAAVCVATTAAVVGVGAPVARHLLSPAKWHPGHYIVHDWTGGSLERTLGQAGRDPVLTGVMRSYAWAALEPSQGRYDFSAIESDLQYVESIGKRLFIVFKYKSDSGIGNDAIPAYLHGPDYGGGVYVDTKNGRQAVRWNVNVQQRLFALIRALGARFDKEPCVEGISNVDTSVRMRLDELEAYIRQNPATQPYDDDAFIASIKAEMNAMKEAFPHSVAIYNIDFLPNQRRARELCEHALAVGVGIGGPVAVENRWLEMGAYGHHAKLAGQVPLGNYMHWGGYGQRRADGTPVTVEEVLFFARDRLRLNYLFWQHREPQFTEQVLPALRKYGHVLDRRKPVCAGRWIG
ncbi:MAG: sigma-70 family RNA polymerase sigma factor [Kiritimatiellae bacterium]|nr:sigma-70 family RNA polymerase sigma factor [Kiritimatiellia bacterium]